MTRNFNQFTEEEFEKLDLYTKAIVRAHGDHHPEFAEIRRSFENILEKHTNENPNLTSEFKDLREATNNYNTPADTCETTVATFDLLKEADELYTNA